MIAVARCVVARSIRNHNHHAPAPTWISQIRKENSDTIDNRATTQTQSLTSSQQKQPVHIQSIETASPTIQCAPPPSKRSIDKSKVPKLDEFDLEEKFISGGGPGGQKVNKAVNCCQLRHKPTGIIVKVHQSRSLPENRKIARELLVAKLDNLYNGEQSVENQKRRLALYQKELRKKQNEARRAMKEEFRKTLVQTEQT